MHGEPGGAHSGRRHGSTGPLEDKEEATEEPEKVKIRRSKHKSRRKAERALRRTLKAKSDASSSTTQARKETDQEEGGGEIETWRSCYTAGSREERIT